MADLDRFRSFAERYIVARAACFRTGHEREDGWLATQDAKTIYNGIEAASRAEDVCDNRKAQQAGVAGNASQGPAGATGAHGPMQGPGSYRQGGQMPPHANMMTPAPSPFIPAGAAPPVPPVAPLRKRWGVF